MKYLTKILKGSIISMLLILPGLVFSQIPNEYLAFSSIVRGKDGVLAFNQEVGIKITIKRDLTELYTEIHSTTSNEVGMIRLKIGSQAGGLSAINWELSGNYFMKWEIDPEGGTNYTIMGESPILTVPYAIHSIIADSALRRPTNLPLNTDSTRILAYKFNYEWVNNALPPYMAGDSARALTFTSDTSYSWTSYDTIPSGGEGEKKLLQFSVANGLEWIQSDTIPDGGGTDSILVYEGSNWQWVPYNFPPDGSSNNAYTALAAADDGYSWENLWSYPSKTSANTNFALSVGGSTDSLSWVEPAQFEYNNITIGQNDSLGGFVFYVTSDGKHGLVAYETGLDANWFEAQGLTPKQFVKPGGVNPANFLDWRLPTKKEVDLLMSTGFSFVGPQLIWSSSEDFVTAKAYYQKDSSNSEWLDILKTDKVYEDNGYIYDIKVIAVRSF